MSTTNDFQTHHIPFSIDWNSMDCFIREIEYDDNQRAHHQGRLVEDILDQALNSLDLQ